LIEYVPFYATGNSLFQGNKIGAVGVGVVELSVKLHPKRHGPKTHGTLLLHNVLHVPGAMCNILVGPLTGDYAGYSYDPSMEDDSLGKIVVDQEKRLGYLRPVVEVNRRLSAIQLSAPARGPLLGPSLLRLLPRGHYIP